MFSAFASRFLKRRSAERIYMDYAAATPLLPEAKAAMELFLDREYGHPSAIHKEGRTAKGAIEKARESLGRTLRVRPSDITFVSGGTEANHLAIEGYVRTLIKDGASYGDIEIISTKLEHPSILKLLEYLKTLGIQIQYCPVDEEGIVKIKELQSRLSQKTKLTSFSYINSEIGVIQPVSRITRVVQEHNRVHGTDIKTHLDAAQAPLWVDCALDRLGVDIMTFDGGKFCGPKGTGALIIRGDIKISPLMHGGVQESGCRAGTENVAGIVGFQTAFKNAQTNFNTRADEVSDVRNYFFSELKKHISGVMINGSTENRVANNINISISGLDTEYAAVVLDTHGVACSTKSACSGAGSGESVVVKEISGDEKRASSTLRFTLHSEIKKTHIDTVIAILKKHIERMGQL